MRILDVNLLLYAIDEESPKHGPARTFLDAAMRDDATIGLPWAVVTAFLRLTTNPRIFRAPLTVGQAITVVDTWLARPNVALLDAGPEHWTILRELLRTDGTAANRVSDAHLAAMAIERGAELCSADADFARYPRLRWTNPLA